MSPRRRLRPAPPTERLPRTRAMLVATHVAPIHAGPRAAATAGLAAALARTNLDVTVVAPLPPDADPVRWGLARRLRPLAVPFEGATRELAVHDGSLPAGRAALFLVDCGNRADLLCAAALEVGRAYDCWPDALHAVDESTAPVLRMAADERGRPVPRRIASVHATGAAIPADAAAADAIVAPSPQWARTLADGGAAPADKLHGILSGVETVRWNPRRDPALPAPFDARDLDGKAACKHALQVELGLPRRPKAPLIACVCDLTSGAGGELVLAAGDELGTLDGQLVLLATGDETARAAARSLAERNPTRIAARTEPDEALRRRAYAGGDFALDPGRFSGGSLNPLVCWRYGAVPILCADAGLSDSVVDFDEQTGTGSALLFRERTAAAVIAALHRAIRIHGGPHMETLAHRVMDFDLSWNAAARRYAELYG